MSLFMPNPKLFAQNAWTAIQDKPCEIVILRGNENLDAQTVRVEYSSGASKFRAPVTTPGRQGVTVFGIRDHASLEDTDIKSKDRFLFDGKMFEVIQTYNTIGEIQAVCEAVN